MAEMLNMPPNSYARYEDPSLFKRPFLPVELARKIAAVLADHAIEPAEVMAVAGVTETESRPMSLE